jgi:hypothetical protein
MDGRCEDVDVPKSHVILAGDHAQMRGAGDEHEHQRKQLNSFENMVIKHKKDIIASK